MSLPIGTRLGPYEILAPLGAGGMGEVYKAKDTRLDRAVAIKVLARSTADRSELRQRFEREGRVIASLNHTHICDLYDIGEQDGVDFLVMEYLEGETLAARLARGPMPCDLVLRYGIEMAGALAEAHSKGILHRDLKPANVMLTRSGSKLLDFGLARIIQPVDAGLDSNLPTISDSLTQKGAILGTFQYMPPEQLEGKDSDARGDIFALGAVLYEMAAGRKAFPGQTQASLIAEIMTGTPPAVSQLQPLTPPALERVIHKCLAKDPAQRWQTAADLRDELVWIASGATAVTSASRARRWSRLAWMSAAVLLVLAALAWALRALRPTAPDSRLYRLSLSPPSGAMFGNEANSMALSPDGRLLALVAVHQGKPQLYLRSLDSSEARPVPGSEGEANPFPFWSPDSRYLGFFADRQLKKVLASGAAPPQVICDAPEGRGAAWSGDGVIILSPKIGSPLYRVSAAGGQPTPVTKLDASRAEDAHYWPQFLPDGKHFIYFARGATPEYSAIVAGSLNSADPPVRLVRSRSAGAYARPGYLLFVTEETLQAQSFDDRRLQLMGEPMPVVGGAGSASFMGLAFFTVSDTGVLAYRIGESRDRRLTWFGPQGQALGMVGAQGAYRGFRLSPDQKRLAVEIVDPQKGATGLWLVELARGVTSRFVTGPRADRSPVWSPAADWIAFFSDRVGPANVYRKATSGAGTEERLTEKDHIQFTNDWSSDGRYILFQEQDPETRWDLWVLPLASGAKPEPFLKTPFNEIQGQFSPGGRYVAYVSDETGRNEVYIQTFPASGQRWQVSTEGGSQPRWRRNGNEIFYVAPGEILMAAPVQPSAAGFEVGAPKPLFEHRALSTDGPYFTYDVSEDGQRFLLAVPPPDANPTLIEVMTNWTVTLKK